MTSEQQVGQTIHVTTGKTPLVELREIGAKPNVSGAGMLLFGEVRGRFKNWVELGEGQNEDQIVIAPDDVAHASSLFAVE